MNQKYKTVDRNNKHQLNISVIPEIEKIGWMRMLNLDLFLFEFLKNKSIKIW